MGNDSQLKAKLSQWDALMLESLKAYGWPDDTLIEKVRTGDLPSDNSKFQFDYAALTALATDSPAVLEQAVRHGYQIKYNTIRGIHSWILVALQLEAELLLEPGSEAVIAALTPQEAELVGSVLSFGWSLSPATGDESDRRSYKIEPAGNLSV
ncbi:hypothetical protein ACFQZE_19350 [Paenibacillus sp. GCM10027627]|uniref:hypothetical protein n=1 Tax=unclassified Paenibacillus TaxID=185978 RepID=UPI00364357FD